jgi:hypothetical protein
VAGAVVLLRCGEHPANIRSKTMPRNVRNFWFEADVDGRDSVLAGGPVAKDGGFRCKILIRRNGEVDTAAIIRGIANPDGTLELMITGLLKGETVARIKVESER